MREDCHDRVAGMMVLGEDCPPGELSELDLEGWVETTRCFAGTVCKGGRARKQLHTEDLCIWTRESENSLCSGKYFHVAATEGGGKMEGETREVGRG